MKKIFLSFAAILAGTFFLGAQQMPQLPNDPAVRKGQLDNGLTYYIRHNEKPQGRAEFYLATNVGAIQETPDQDGLAHFLEHMCFNGTKNFPEKGILDWLQSIGASFGGNVNASTGVEQTQYMLNNIPLVRQSVIDTCLLILHDYSHFVTNDPAEIDKERGVIVEERRSRRNAAWRLHERSLPYYYGDTKYGSCTLIGSQENLLNFKPESLVNFYQTWYHPAMQAVVVVGDVDVDYVEAKLAEIFADIPAKENPQAKEVITIPDNEKPLVGILTDPEQTSVNWEVLWKSEAMPEEYNSTAVGLMQDLLKGIVSQVMAERFGDITAKADAPYLAADLAIGNLCETMEVVMGNVVAREGEALPALAAYLTEIEKMKRFGFSEDEVTRAKENIRAGYETAANQADTRSNAEFVPELISNFFDNTPYMEPKTAYELVQQVLPQFNATVVNQVAQQVITPENMVVLYKAPEKEGLVHPTVEQVNAIIEAVREAEIEANAAEEMEKDFLDPASLKGAKVKKAKSVLYGATEWMLANGVKVVLYPSDLEKDRITFDLELQGGESLIPTEDLPSFEANVFGLFLQNSGVGRFPSTTVGKMLSGKNLTVSPYFSGLRHGISGSSTVKDLETALQIMYLMFTEPRFDPEEFEIGINQLKAILPNYVNQPNYKLQQEMYKTLYDNNPRNVLVSMESLEKANLETIERNWRRLFKDAAGAVVYITGDFQPEAIRPLVQKYIGSLPKGKKPLQWVDDGNDILPGRRIDDFAVDMQTPMTTVLEVLTAPMPYSFETSVAISAVSYIMDMRYTKSLREDEGGTYGASTSGSITREPKQQAVFQVTFQCKPSVADKLRELAAQGLKDLAENGPTAEEFDMTLKNLQKNIPERRIRNSYWEGALKNFYRHGLDTDKGYEAAVNALTPLAIQRMTQALLAHDNFAELVMRPDNTAEEE